MKIIGSWKHKYIGIQFKSGMCYYVNWTHPTCREWGFKEDWHDGPMKRFVLYFIAFQWHYDWDD